MRQPSVRRMASTSRAWPLGRLRCRGDDLANAAVRAAREQWQDVLPHPRPADLTGDAVRIFSRREFEDEDEVPVVDLDDPRSRCAGVEDAGHDAAELLRRLVAERVPQMQM